ncbi:RNA-directed DNA polymerase, eukaryota, partial [Tanacetum coccineum]
VILSNSNDRWVSDLNGDGIFRVKDVRNLLDELFLPRADVPTRWVKNILIKVNIFAWKLALDRLPTRANLAQRNVVTESESCPVCDAILKDTSHLFFNCSLARDVARLLCRWHPEICNPRIPFIEEISSPEGAKTPVESPNPMSTSVGSSSPVRSTTSPPNYLFNESIFAELDNSLWIISRPLRSKPVPEEFNVHHWK